MDANWASSQIYIAPDVNYANAVHADKWIPILPNTDAALYLAIAYQWFKDGTYDKEYLETHAYGVDKFEDYVMGKEDGIPKTPEWAAAITGVPCPHHQGAGQRVGVQADHRGPSATGARASVVRTRPSRLVCRCSALPCRVWASPGCNQAKMIEWGLLDDMDQDVTAVRLLC